MKLHEFRAEERKAQEQYARECAIAYKQHARLLKTEENEWHDEWMVHVWKWRHENGLAIEVTNEAGLRAHLIAKGLLVPARLTHFLDAVRS